MLIHPNEIYMLSNCCFCDACVFLYSGMNRTSILGRHEAVCQLSCQKEVQYDAIVLLLRSAAKLSVCVFIHSSYCYLVLYLSDNKLAKLLIGVIAANFLYTAIFLRRVLHYEVIILSIAYFLTELNRSVFMEICNNFVIYFI